MPIVFGSPEAAEIVAKDKELQRRVEEEARRSTPEYLDERIAEIESEIEDYLYQIGNLRMERDDLIAKRKS